jgi:hypothetical protein
VPTSSNTTTTSSSSSSSSIHERYNTQHVLLMPQTAMQPSTTQPNGTAGVQKLAELGIHSQSACCLLLLLLPAHLIPKAAVADADVLQLPVELQHAAQLGSCCTADGMAAAYELLQDSVLLQGAAQLRNILQAARQIACCRHVSDMAEAYCNTHEWSAVQGQGGMANFG